MSKAGKSDAGMVGGLGREHPSPESIPHSSHLSQQLNPQSPGGSLGGGTPGLYPTYSQGQSGSPVKESSILQRGMSVDEQDNAEEIAQAVDKAVEEKGIPIRKQ